MGGGMKQLVGVLFAFLSFSALADCGCNRNGTSGTTYSSSGSSYYQMGANTGCGCNRNRIPENAYSSPYYEMGSGGCGTVVPYWPPCRNPNGEEGYGYYSSGATTVVQGDTTVVIVSRPTYG